MSDHPRATPGEDAPAETAPPTDAAVSDVAAAPEASSADEAAPAEAGAPKKRRKKKKKPEDAAESEPQIFERPRLDAKGIERPAFLLRFPEDPELEPVIAAFEAGNYAHVRAAAQKLSEQGQTPEVRRAADELLRRIDPDPLMKLFLAVAIALLLVVVAYGYMGH
jgi:hypothetical protein